MGVGPEQQVSDVEGKLEVLFGDHDCGVRPQGGFDPDLVVPPKDQRKMDRFILFALVAAAEAMAQAAWTPSDAHSLERTGTVIASGIGGFPAIVEAVRTPISAERGASRPSLCRP